MMSDGCVAEIANDLSTKVVSTRETESSKLSELSHSGSNLKYSHSVHDKIQESSKTNQKHYKEGTMLRSVQVSKGNYNQSRRENDELSSDTSSSTSYIGGKNVSGNWGWFEDVHAPEGKNGEDSSSYSKDSKSSTKQKRSLLEFDHALSKPINLVVNPNTDPGKFYQLGTRYWKKAVHFYYIAKMRMLLFPVMDS